MVLLECQRVIKLCNRSFYSRSGVLHFQFRLLLREKECNFGQWTEFLCTEERDQSKHILVDRIFILAKIRVEILLVASFVVTLRDKTELRARSLNFWGRRGRSLESILITCCKEHTPVCD